MQSTKTQLSSDQTFCTKLTDPFGAKTVAEQKALSWKERLIADSKRKGRGAAQVGGTRFLLVGGEELAGCRRLRAVTRSWDVAGAVGRAKAAGKVGGEERAGGPEAASRTWGEAGGVASELMHF